jgi:hypothetical protein
VADWQRVDQVAKNDAGQYMALVGGQWQPAEGGAKNDAGQYMALLSGGGIDQSVQDPRDAQAQGKAGIQLPPEQQGPTEQPQGAVGLQNTQPGYFMGEGSKALARGLLDVKQMPQAIKVFASSENVKIARDKLAAWNQIDDGTTPPPAQPQPGDPEIQGTEGRTQSWEYAQATPQQRIDMRAKVLKSISDNQDDQRAAIKVWQEFAAQNQKLTGRVPRLTDVHDATDFRDYLTSRLGEGALPLAAMVTASAIPRVGFGLVSAIMAGTSVAGGTGAALESAQTPAMGGQHVEGRWVPGQAATIQPNDAQAVMDQRRAGIGIAAGAETAMGALSPTQAVGRDALGAAVQGIKSIVGRVAAKAGVGAADMGVQNLAQYGMDTVAQGETPTLAGAVDATTTGIITGALITGAHGAMHARKENAARVAADQDAQIRAAAQTVADQGAAPADQMRAAAGMQPGEMPGGPGEPPAPAAPGAPEVVGSGGAPTDKTAESPSGSSGGTPPAPVDPAVAQLEQARDLAKNSPSETVRAAAQKIIDADDQRKAASTEAERLAGEVGHTIDALRDARDAGNEPLATELETALAKLQKQAAKAREAAGEAPPKGGIEVKEGTVEHIEVPPVDEEKVGNERAAAAAAEDKDERETYYGTDQPKDALTGSDADRAASRGRSPLLKGLRDAGGIRTDQLSEIGLDRKRADGKRQSWSIGQGQPLFHKQGALADDSLAEHLHQHGYLADESDVDGAHEMVRQEWENPGSVKPLRERDRQAEDALSARYDRERDQELAEEARAIGIDPTGRTSEDLQSAVIAAHHADWTHLAQHGLTPDHAADWAEVHRAAHRDLAATEEAGRQYPAHGDDFMRAIREINGGLDSERESNQGGDQHQSGPGGEAGKPAVRGESAEAANADRGTGQEPADRAGNGQQGRDAGEPGGNAQAGPEVPDGGAERRTATAAQGRGPLDEAGIRRFARAAQAAAQKAGFDLKELFRKGYVRIVDSSNASHPLASHPGVSALYVPPIRGADGKMERRGYVEIYADRADPQRIPELILHEVGDHLGLLGLGRAGYDKLLNEILDNRNAPDVQRTWREVAQNYPDLPEGGRAFLREVSAHLAETGADRGTTRKLLDHAQAMAYKTLGIRLGRTGDLVRGLAAAMARSIQNSRFDIAKERMAIPEREGESIRIAREASAAGRAAWAAANGGAAAKQTELRGPLSADQARAHPSIGPVMAAADSLGLSALHEATDFNVQEAHHGDDAATVHIGTDGRVKITLWGAHNDLVDSGDPRDLSQAQRLVYHELMHVMDAANRGGIYSAHPDLWIDRNRAGDIVGIGDAARELIQLYRNNDLLNKMLHYPLHTDYSGMGPTELPKELFAQAQTAYLAKTAREIIEREAPNAARYLRIALEQARGAKAPLTESDRQIARTAFAAATRRGTDERSATAADSGRPGGGGDAGGRPGFDGIAASQRTERERDPILDVRPAPIWKSALHDAVASMPDKKMPGSSWLAEIKGLVNKGKVKAEELRWVGLDDALKAAPGKLSRDDVAKWIADNGVKLDEVRYGDTGRAARDAAKAARNRVLDVLKEARGFMEAGGVDADEMASALNALQHHKPESGVDDPQLTKAYELLREHAPPGYDFNTINDAHDAHARAVADLDAARNARSDTRFGDYTLPGGENYKETVLTLPSRNAEAKAQRRSTLDEARQQAKEDWSQALKDHGEGRIDGNELIARARASQNRLSEIEAEIRQHDLQNSAEFTHAGHWPGVENPIAHLRTTDRVDAEGKRNLHVEEFQSDWGEQGRSKGFSDKSKVADAERRLEAFDAETRAMKGAIVDQMHELAKNGHRAMSDEDNRRWQDLDRQQTHLTDERWAQRAPLNDELSRARSGVPLAPFVGNTQHWVALLIKRAIRMAAEGGYDRVTWSRGDQINNHFSLSSVVRKISWDAEPERNLRHVVMDLTQYGDPMELVVDNRNGEIAQVSDTSQNAWVGKNLSEVIGKEMADKVMSDKVEYGSLEGAGLKVGGEGNRKFYDQVVPNVANDVLKKFGGGRVREVDYGNGPASVERFSVFFDDDAVNNGERGGWYIEDENGSGESGFATREEAQAKANEYNKAEDNSTAIGRQQGFDITPEMRAQASEAMPMFSKREGPRARDPILDTRPGTDARDQNSSDIAASQRTPKDDIGLTYPGAKMPGGGGTPPRRPGAPGPAATPPGGTPPLAQRNPFYRRIWDSPFLQKARDLAGNIFRDIQSKTSPMTATSTKEFQAMAKDYANAMRQGRQKFAEWFDILNRNYNADQLRRMWEAGDEENDMRREQRLNGTPLDPSKGLASLPKDQRDVMDFMSAYGTKLLAEAKALGMYEGEGVDYWVPRTAARIGADGDYEPLLPGARGEGGGSPRTKSKNLTGRNWDTTAEAEAALQGREGTGAKFIRDIRTMPLAMRRLEEAIAGRRLVDRVLEESQKMALDPAAFVPASDHPAFKVYQADINDPTAPWKVTTMRIPKEAKGPLDAVLSKAPGDAYKGLLALKNWGVGNIMFSPFIHLGVELGRAAPVMRGKMMTLGFWKDGAAMLRNPDLLRQAIGEGYVKIGRQNLSEDMSSMEREPELHPGRGLTAQVAGLAARPFGKNARQAAMRGVDRIGDFVHGTLLWDRIAQLQAGIYLTTRKAAIAKGMQPRVAGIVAAHIANRYAGALPPESISSAGRKVANLLLFSRSFTLGNLGVMKDALTGLPQDVRAQIETEFGQAQLVKATSYSRRKAFAGVIADVGMMAALNAVAQSGISALNKQQQDPEWDKQLLSKLKFLGAEGVGGVVGMGALGVPGMVAGAVGAGWLADHKAAVAQSHDLVDSMVRGMKSAAMDPVHAVLHPFDTLESMSPTYRNEPGKGDRILVGHQPDGTAIYVRLPFGKVAEEIKGWATRAAWRGPENAPSMLEQKSSTLVHPLQYAYTNDTGFGRKLYKDNDDVLVKGGKIAGELMKEQVPADSIASAYRMLQGKGQPMDPEKFLGPLLGLTFSKGAPGGEASGELFREESRHKADVADAAPDIKQAIKDGDQATAKRLMDAAGMIAEERRSMIKHTLHPETYVSARALRQFQQTATPEEKARMASARAARQPAQPEQ